MKKITEFLGVTDPKHDLNSENITKWVVGEEECVTDLNKELIQDALGWNIDSSESEDNVNIEKVKHADAVNVFAVIIRWTKENNQPFKDVLILKRLKEKATDSVTAKNVQTKIDTYFRKNKYSAD